ncbi:hypothetical protein PENSPDRAFT_309555 [Peniophora sp. CONT]|nr:hypothetical protein PENSPDRAFT_309555 [Peniophora sp. CONT]
MPLTHRGYSVHIESDGKELPQFQVEQTDERTVTCWIPSEAGKRFSAHHSTTQVHDHGLKSVRLFADGRRLVGVGSRDETASSLEHRAVSATSKVAFVFSEVAFAPDEDDNTATANISNDLGTIDVQIWPAMLVDGAGYPLYNVEERSTIDLGIKLTERSKLIGANHVKLGTAESFVSNIDPTKRAMSLGGDTRPYALFRFKHRPLAVLQAMGIAPRPAQHSEPVPPAASSSIPVTSTSRPIRRSPTDLGRAQNKRRRLDDPRPTLDEDIKPVITDYNAEAKRLRIQANILARQAEIANKQADVAAMQAELADMGSASTATATRDMHVKAERATSPISVPRSGEVIDLTDD